MTECPPFLPFFIAALIIPLTRGWLRGAVLLTVPVLGGLHLLSIAPGIHWQITLFGLELAPFRMDRLSLLFGYLFHIASFIGFMFALHVRDPMQQVAAMIYTGSAIGAVFAGDLISLFVFWELMAVSSVFLIWARRTGPAIRAGLRYLVIQITSGLLLFAGALAWYQTTGSLAFGYVGLAGLAGWLLLLAFGIKAVFPLLHNWLTDAYPQATPTGTVFMSVITTKVAVYALARGFPGTELLIYVGAVMTCFPIFYAVIENDLRRVLAYSMINQIGFMVCGIGLGTALAINGALAHAFNNVLFKGLLFMTMGAVLYMTGRSKGTELGGLYKSMPITTGLCLVGAASISAFPLFAGFVSKAMIMSATLEQGHTIIWLAMLFASAGVFHHAGIKIPYFAFFAHDAGIRTQDPPLNMLLAMSVAATLCVLIGIYPSLLYQLLPFEVEFNPYDVTHVLAQLQLLFFSAAAFAWLKVTKLYPPELESTNLDVEWVYRRAAPKLLAVAGAMISRLDKAARTGIRRGVLTILKTLFLHHGPKGVLARTWPTGSMVLWVAVLLGLYLVLYYH